jgi:hypothetical protein
MRKRSLRAREKNVALVCVFHGRVTAKLVCSSMVQVCVRVPCACVFLRDKREFRGCRRRGAARCSVNNWYQSPKIRGGGSGSGLHAGWRPRCEKEVVCGAMPLTAGCGAMPLGGDGGVILPKEEGSMMPLREDDGEMPFRRRWCDAAACRRWWCDAIIIMRVGAKPTKVAV